MNALEKHYQAVAALGCVVCKMMGMGFTPAELHHPYGRKGEHEKEVIPLCYSHHRAGFENKMVVSRHPYKKEFERRYGKESDLLAEVKRLIK